MCSNQFLEVTASRWLDNKVREPRTVTLAGPMERAAVGQEGGRGDPGKNGWYYKLLKTLNHGMVRKNCFLEKRKLVLCCSGGKKYKSGMSFWVQFPRLPLTTPLYKMRVVIPHVKCFSMNICRHKLLSNQTIGTYIHTYICMFICVPVIAMRSLLCNQQTFIGHLL